MRSLLPLLGVLFMASPALAQRSGESAGVRFELSASAGRPNDGALVTETRLSFNAPTPTPVRVVRVRIWESERGRAVPFTLREGSRDVPGGRFTAEGPGSLLVQPRGRGLAPSYGRIELTMRVGGRRLTLRADVQVSERPDVPRAAVERPEDTSPPGRMSFDVASHPDGAFRRSVELVLRRIGAARWRPCVALGGNRSGTAVLRVSVTPAGVVSNVEVVRTELPQDVMQCLRRRLRSLRFVAGEEVREAVVRARLRAE